MNAQSKSPLSGIFAKIVLAVVLVIGALVILSGVLLNIKEIGGGAVPSKLVVRQTFASLPEYAYIQSHMDRTSTVGKNVPLSGFQALPEYGYIWMQSSFSSSVSQSEYLPAGLRSLAISGYIASHNRIQDTGKPFSIVAPLPQGLRDQTVSGYIDMHNRMSAETFVAGLPRGLRALPESGYIQAHQAASK